MRRWHPTFARCAFGTTLFSRQVRSRKLRDLAKGKDVSIRCSTGSVLAAGPIASSKILMRSVFQVLSPVGKRISANVVLPVFAFMPAEPKPGPSPREPGIQMCSRVRGAGRAAAGISWFHYPASLAIALPEWLRAHAEIMRQYAHLAACGVVVPTGNRGEIGPGMASRCCRCRTGS